MRAWASVGGGGLSVPLAAPLAVVVAGTGPSPVEDAVVVVAVALVEEGSATRAGSPLPTSN